MEDLHKASVKKIDFHNHIWLPGDPDGDGLVAAMDKMGVEKNPGGIMGTMHLDLKKGRSHVALG